MERIGREGRRIKERKMKCTIRIPRELKNTLYSPKEILLLHTVMDKKFQVLEAEFVASPNKNSGH